MTTLDETSILSRIEQLEDQEKLLTDAVRYLLEDRLEGEMPHAAGQVVALLGGEAAAAAANFQPKLEARFSQLEQQREHLTNAIRYVVEGRWTGPMPHAAAEVVALLGGEAEATKTNFSPVDFRGVPSAAPVSGDQTAQDLLAYARTLTDVKYEINLPGGPHVPGGRGFGKKYPDVDKGLDCSGFVLNVLQHFGRVSDLDPDLTSCDVLFSHCDTIDRAQALPGDLVFFEGTYDAPGKTHIGIVTEPAGTAMISSRIPGVGEDRLVGTSWVQFLSDFGRLKG
jgi:cell wall-associated NlpC family hydrolase